MELAGNNRFIHESREFIQQHKSKKLYQPIIFIPNVLEYRGKWHEETKQLASQILQDVEGMTLLDLGCNIGFFVREAHRRGAAQTTGIDLDPYVIEKAKQIDIIHGFNCEFIFGDARSFQEQYDIIIILNVLHVIKKPEILIRHSYEHCRVKMILEVEKKHMCFFDSYDKEVCDSPRAYGWRKLVTLKK